LNFVQSIRSDLGLSPELPRNFLQECAAVAEKHFSSERSFWQWLDDLF
jgi:hypothetical protein